MKKLLLLLLLILTALLLTPQTGAVESITTITSFQQLPQTSEAVDVEVKVVSSKYELTFLIKNKIYRLTTSTLPHEVNTEMKEKYKGVAPRSMTYYTVDNNNHLWYDFQDNPADGTILAEVGSNHINGFRPFVDWNITTNDLEITNKLILYGVPIVKLDNSLYFDVVFPMELDALLQISMMFESRTTSFWLFKNKWQTHNITRVIGHTEYKYDWWQYLISNVIEITANILSANNADHIQDVSSDYKTATQKENFTKKVNKYLSLKSISNVKVSDLFKTEYSVYRIYGDTIKSFGQTGIEISEGTITEVLYIYKGEYYYVPPKDILSIITDYATVYNAPWWDLNKLVNTVNNYLGIIIVIAIAIVLIIMYRRYNTYRSYANYNNRRRRN